LIESAPVTEWLVPFAGTLIVVVPEAVPGAQSGSVVPSA
jgi:hypothetical protein